MICTTNIQKELVLEGLQLQHMSQVEEEDP